MPKDFDLLKRSYPVSQYDRYCDGYKYILENTMLKHSANSRE